MRQQNARDFLSLHVITIEQEPGAPVSYLFLDGFLPKENTRRLPFHRPNLINNRVNHLLIFTQKEFLS
jgi:hypothetical protein